MRLRFVLVFIVLAASVAAGQSFRGGIVGTVVDSSGASVAEANVKATNADTGLTRDAVTSGTGDFSFAELPLGTYSVTVAKEGFRTATATSIRVAVGDLPRVVVTMTPGQVTQKVEVNAEVPLVETTGNTLGGTLEATQLA